MEKGTKYYSINGKPTKAAIKERIAHLTSEMENYEKAKAALFDLQMIAKDHQTIGGILDGYVLKRREEIEKYKSLLKSKAKV